MSNEDSSEYYTGPTDTTGDEDLVAESEYNARTSKAMPFRSLPHQRALHEHSEDNSDSYSYSYDDPVDSFSHTEEYSDYTETGSSEIYDPVNVPHQRVKRNSRHGAVLLSGSKKESRMSKASSSARSNNVTAVKTPDLSSLMQMSRAGESSRNAVEGAASPEAKYRVINDVPPAVSSEPEKSFVNFTIAGTRRELFEKYVASSGARSQGMDKHLVLPINSNLVAALLQRDRYRDPVVTLSNKFSYDLSNVTVTSIKLHTLSNRLHVPVHLKSKESLLNTVPVLTSFDSDPSLNKIMGTLPASEEIVDKCLYSLNSDYLRSPSFYSYFGRSIGDRDVIPVTDEATYGKRSLMAVRRSTHDRHNMFHHFARRNITEAEKYQERVVRSNVEMEGGLYDVFDADELAKWQVKFMSVVKSVPTVKPATALTLALSPVNSNMTWEQYVTENPEQQVSFSMTVCVHWIAPVKQEQAAVVVVAAAPSPSREDIAKAKLSDYNKRLADAAKSESL